jgi:hypothetical protein
VEDSRLKKDAVVEKTHFSRSFIHGTCFTMNGDDSEEDLQMLKSLSASADV